MSVFSFIVLLPINFVGGGHLNAYAYKDYVGKIIFTDFLRFTMANVSGGSPRLWVHCFAAYLLTGIVVKELLVEYSAFSHVRHRYLLARETHLRTVLVTNIPRHLRTPTKITTYFKHVYPDAVKAVTISQNVIYLERLVNDRTRVLTNIEKELLMLCRREKRKLVGMTKLEHFMQYTCSFKLGEDFGCLDGPQERLAKLYSQLEVLNNQVSKEQKRRRKVMKNLDRMEAGARSGDIDYILASPFVGEEVEEVSVSGSGSSGGGKSNSKKNQHPQETADVENGGSYQPPNIVVGGGGGRNVSESKWDAEAGQYTEDSFANAGSGAGSGTGGGAVHRRPNSTNHANKDDDSSSMSTADEHENDAVHGTARVDSTFDNHNHTIPGGNSKLSLDSTDSNRKSARKPLLRAKQALRRYVHLAFFGKANKNTEGGGAASGGGGEHGEDHHHNSISNDNGDDSQGQMDTIEDHTIEVTDKAFVEMRTFTASTIAMQSMHSSKPGSMKVRFAPEPRE
jgi:hypothetical protein